MSDGSVVELSKLFLSFLSELSLNNTDSALDLNKIILEKSSQYFKNVKQFGQRAVFTKFMISAVIVSTCFDQCYGGFVPLVKLCKQKTAEIAHCIRTTVKTLFDANKRRSAVLLFPSSKLKHQEGMDELLQGLYPAYSVCRGLSQPYQVDKQT